jgi:hypothetical protein
MEMNVGVSLQLFTETGVERTTRHKAHCKVILKVQLC